MQSALLPKCESQRDKALDPDDTTNLNKVSFMKVIIVFFCFRDDSLRQEADCAAVEP